MNMQEHVNALCTYRGAGRDLRHDRGLDALQRALALEDSGASARLAKWFDAIESQFSRFDRSARQLVSFDLMTRYASELGF